MIELLRLGVIAGLICSLLPAPAFGVDAVFFDQNKNRILKLSQTKQWHRLLHYNTDWLGRYKSDRDGGDFFLSPVGLTDPHAELISTLENINSDKQIGDLKQRPFCAFPARYRFLKDNLGIKLPNYECARWKDFLQMMHNPVAVSVVFSSAYSGNPASMFGHLFFKFHSGRDSDLLDAGMNMAARVADDENGFAFLYFGVFGGYEGHWYYQPYFEKVNEYIKSESRDLVEYKLNFTKEQTRFLLEHIWELETTSKMQYYFFDENCAYEIMRAVEVIKPEWTLTDHTIYVIPGEVLKNLTETPDAIAEVKFKPALRKRLLKRYELLNADQKQLAKRIIGQESNLINGQSKEVLDLLNIYYDFRRQKKKGKITEAESQSWQQVRLARSQLHQPSASDETLGFKDDTRPELGHDAYSWMSGFGMESVGSSDFKPVYIFKAKSAYHDLLNRDLGYKKFSEILFPWAELRYRPDINQLTVEEIGGVKAVSVMAVHPLDWALSWKTLIAIESVKDFGCLNCRHLVIEPGLGQGWDFLNEMGLFYSFLGLRIEASEDLVNKHRLLPYAEAGMLAQISDNHKLLLQADYFKDVGSNRIQDEFYRLQIQHSFASQRNWDLRSGGRVFYHGLASQSVYAEARLDFSYYFR